MATNLSLLKLARQAKRTIVNKIVIPVKTGIYNLHGNPLLSPFKLKRDHERSKKNLSNLSRTPVIPAKAGIYYYLKNSLSITFCIFFFPIINNKPAIIQTIKNKPKNILPIGVEIP